MKITPLTDICCVIGFFTAIVFLSLASCGNKSDSEIGLTLDLIFPETISEIQKTDLLRKIEIYRFKFLGTFGEHPPVEVERKKYSQYVFWNIPYDERIEVLVDVLDMDRHPLCHGKNVFSYLSGKKDRVFIVLNCT